MRVIDSMRRSVVTIAPDATIQDAAQLMDQANVGALVVVDGEQLVGIVTDRDLVRRATARGVAADGRVDYVMSSPVVTIAAGTDMHEAYGVFRTHAVRRLPIVEGNRPVGLLAVDDLLVTLASELGDLARPVMAEVVFGHHDTPVPAPAG